MEVDIDAYKDGEFKNFLTETEKEILGYCWYIKWETKLGNNDIERKPKVRDKSFEMPSESALTSANSVKLERMRAELYQKIQRYENNFHWLKQQKGETWRG